MIADLASTFTRFNKYENFEMFGSSLWSITATNWSHHPCHSVTLPSNVASSSFGKLQNCSRALADETESWLTTEAAPSFRDRNLCVAKTRTLRCILSNKDASSICLSSCSGTINRSKSSCAVCKLFQRISNCSIAFQYLTHVYLYKIKKNTSMRI